jgi:hypothetical protein
MEQNSAKLLQAGVSITSRTRPIRIAYIIGESENSKEILDSIFAECYSRWGGRRSLIIPLVENEIDSSYFKWLEWFDPDMVYCYSELNQSILDLIDSKILPIWLLKHPFSPDERANWSKPKFPIEFVSSLSNLPLYSNHSLFNPQDDNKYLIDQLPNWEDDGFIGDNFGAWLSSFGNFPPRTEGLAIPLTIANEDIPQYQYEKKLVTSEAQLLEVMSKSKGTLSLSLLSSKSPYTPTPDHHSIGDSLNLVIGEDFKDRITFWNNRLLLPDWQDNLLSALRVSQRKFDDTSFTKAFADFLNLWNHMAPSNMSGQGFITMRSSSISIDQLEGIKQKLITQGIYNGAGITAEILQPQFPNQSNYAHRAYILNEFPERHRCLETPTQIKPNEPYQYSFITQRDKRFSVGYWANDFKIERHNNLSRFSNISDWWKLPKRKDLISCFGPETTGKVSLEGYLTLIPQVDNPVFIPAMPPNFFIRLKLPDDTEIFTSLFNQLKFHLSEDTRFNESPTLLYKTIEYSRPGKILNGVLEQFSSLASSFEYLTNGFWYKVFCSLGADNKPNEEETDKYKRTLKKRFRIAEGENLNIENEDDWKKLINVLYNTSRDIRLPKGYKSFSDLILFGKDRIEASNDKEKKIMISSSLKRLVNLSIFHQGKLWVCDTCSHRNWTSIENVKTFQDCEICNSSFQAEVNFDWDFYLNEFFSDALRNHGILPVIWALGKLQKSARECFFYISSIELNPKYRGEDGFEDSGSELDFACIIDGKFHIGEVKKSIGYFKDNVIEKLITQANEIKPDVVVLACLEKNEAALQEKAQRVQEACRGNIQSVISLVPSSEDFDEKPNCLPF